MPTSRAKQGGIRLAPGDVRFEAFYVRADAKPARIRALIGRGGPAGAGIAGVTPLAGGDRWLVTTRRPLAPGAAWEVARAIEARLRSAHLEGALVEPLFEIAATKPARKPPSGAKSGGGEEPLPCAAHDCDWSVERVEAYRAWTLSPPAGGKAMGAGVRVGHPDTGYTLHPEIWDANSSRRRLRPDLGYDFLDGRADPRDPLNGGNEGHGTATASVIMSDAGGEAQFVAGIAPAAELVPLRVSKSVVHFSFTNLTKAIDHAVNVAKVDLISMSLGGPFSSKALEHAVEHAIGKGVVLLAAAGNVWPWVVYPARYPEVVAVAASNCRDHPWSDSASGSAVDVTAPGESVWRALTKRGAPAYSVAPSSGTSYAVATTAGVCALWLAFHGGRQAIAKTLGAPERVPARFLELVRKSARRPKKWDDDEFGAGIVDALALLQMPLLAAKGMKSAAKQRPSDDARSRVSELLPVAGRERAIERLDQRLGKTPAARRAAWARFGPEIEFQAATDESFRTLLIRPPSKSKGKVAAAKWRIRRGSTELKGLIERGIA